MTGVEDSATADRSALQAAAAWHGTVRALRDELARSRRDYEELARSARHIHAEWEALLAELRSDRVYHLVKRLARWGARFAPAGSLRQRLLNATVGRLAGIARSAGRLLRPARPAAPAVTPEPAPVSPPELRDPAYERWIAANEPDAAGLAAQRERSAGFSFRPRVSLLTPVYNTPPDLLRATVRSVLDQTYPRWELILADGGSTSAATRAVLAELAAGDPRVRVVPVGANLGISGNTNAALAAAEGEFVGLLDHDDLLAPFALFAVVERLDADPTLDFLYSDRDLVTADGGTRFAPFFKPPWSPSVLLGANYVTHFNVIRTDLIRRIGGLRPETDGAQDWDLFVRVAEATHRIAHIPQVLYHWRVWSQSTADNIDTKAYALQAQLRTVAGHLSRTGRTGCVGLEARNVLRVRRPSPDLTPVTVVIGSGPGTDRVVGLVRSLSTGRYCKQTELVVAHAGGPSERTRELRALGVRIVEGDTPWQARNRAARAGSAAVLVFLDGNAVPRTADWLDEFLQWATQPGVGVVGCRAVFPDGRLAHQGYFVGLGGLYSSSFAGADFSSSLLWGSEYWYRDCLAVTGDCLAVTREAFESVGGFDEGFQHAHADVDFCVRLHEAGRRIFYTPFAEFVLHPPTDAPAVPAEDDLRLAARCERYLREGDPYLNPNLDRGSVVPAFRLPPG